MTPEEVVRAELDAWHTLDIEAIMSFLADDIIWENVPIGVDSGYDEVRKVSEAALGRMTSFQGEILNVAVAGDVVLTERIDHMNWDGQRCTCASWERTKCPGTRSGAGGTTST
jgi:limonene-1,2-epoxide hydrolase